MLATTKREEGKRAGVKKEEEEWRPHQEGLLGVIRLKARREREREMKRQ